MEFLIFIICLVASTVGGVSGIGGGVIIKPVLDAMGIMSVSAISFLSGLTVLSMSMISVLRQRKTHLLEIRIGSLLGIGAVVGGIIGNHLFQTVKALAGNDRFVGMVQALVLAIVTLLTLVYSIYGRKRLPSYHVNNELACAGIGSVMGMLSSFIGIGGGPINLTVLYFAFSMETKKAAANSLFIIIFSQLSNFLVSCMKGTIPTFPWHYLPLMVVAGVLGGILGSKINRKISSETTGKLLAGVLFTIIMICLYNVWRFAR